MEGETFSAKAAFCCAPFPKRDSMYALNESDHVIENRITDSEPMRHQDRGERFRINDTVPGKLRVMATKHEPADPALTGYVQMRLRQEIQRPAPDGRRIHLKDIAAQAGVAKSHPSQILGGTLGVGTRAAVGYARLFGFPSVEELRHAAHVWWREQGTSGVEIVAKPPSQAMSDAIEYVLKIRQGTPSQVQTVMARYTHPDFWERDFEWWSETLMRELRRDYVAIRTDAMAREKQGREQGAVRTQKRRLAEIKASAPISEPEPVRSQRPKSRRKITA